MFGFISFHFRMGVKGLHVNEKNAHTCVAMTNFFSWAVAFKIHAYPLVYADCLFDLVIDTGDDCASSVCDTLNTRLQIAAVNSTDVISIPLVSICMIITDS
jgi:hypothetical protein